MSDIRKAAEQAIKALDEAAFVLRNSLIIPEAAAALRAALAEPEPVTVFYDDDGKEKALFDSSGRVEMSMIPRRDWGALQSLRRAPLTDEQIKQLIPDGDSWKYEVGFDDAIDFARDIEAAHGITKEKI